MKIDLNVCNLCSEENQYYEKTISILRKDFPNEQAILDNNGYIGVPSNHPYWEKWNYLWNQYKTKCLTFEYDDCSESICKKHMEDLMKEM